MNSSIYAHYFDTIRIILIILSFSELSNFDLVITGNLNPIVICSELGTSNVLYEKSPFWADLYSSLNPIFESNLSSTIKVSYGLNILRKVECTNYIFVIIDGLFSTLNKKLLMKMLKFVKIKELMFLE